MARGVSTAPATFYARIHQGLFDKSSKLQVFQKFRDEKLTGGTVFSISL
jgi:hypothetical protein